MASHFIAALGRKKYSGEEGGSKLARVLTLLDLTALGVGSTLGLGVYVLAGAVARTEAGPAVCLSFLVAAIASAVAGLCYAEFAARVPKAGSAYVYSYVSVGEFIAFIIGWNLILEYVIGTASVARGLSNYIDALANNTMQNSLTSAMHMEIDFLAPYPDFLSFGLVMLLTALLAFGVKESSILNNLFTAVNMVTILIVIIAGSIKADTKNWSIPKEDIPPGVSGGEGGFLPYGIAGVMSGAAKCFYGFVGFDCVATTGEEAKNPQRNIPLAIVISLVIIFLAYFAVSTVLTMMWPYYDQDPDAPFPYVFDAVQWPVIKWIVTVGAIFALLTSLLGAMFPLPRVLYAMATDGVIFTFLARIHPKTQTPLIATLISGVFAGIMATIFNLQQLIDMMSIGTLLAYTIVAVCVLILRYQDRAAYQYPNSDIAHKKKGIERTVFNSFKQLFNLNRNKYPNPTTSSTTKWAIALFSALSIGFCAFIIYGGMYINPEEPYGLAGFIILAIIMIIVIVVIGRQPVDDIKLTFKVPWVPVIPCLSVVINLYLMLELDGHTWIRFSVWMLIGFFIYFGYGIFHSVQGQKYRLCMNSKRPSDITASVHSEKRISNGEPNKEVHKETTSF